MSRQSSLPAIDVDFSLAIHNRTGKYFIGRDLLAIPDLPIGDVRYWRFALRRPPAGLLGRIVGRLQLYDVRGHTIAPGFALLPRRRSRRPLLHLDPFTVPTTLLRATDVVLIHDLGHITHEALFDPPVSAIYRRIHAEIARIGPHLVFVSAASRRSYEALYPAARHASLRVIHPAVRTDVDSRHAQPIAGIAPPFLLTVGSIGTRKNQAASVSAFLRSGLATRGVRYVICGGREPGFAEAIAAAAPGVIHLPYVSDGALAWLYGNACGFVLMSLLEGFGVPVAEAIARGLVPLVSRATVLEEVAGPGGLTADPLAIDEIAAAMRVLVDLDPAERARRLALLRASLARFARDRFDAEWRAAFHEILTPPGA